MTHLTCNFRRNENGAIDLDFYRRKTRTGAHQARVRRFQQSVITLIRSIGLMLRSAKRVSKHGAAPSFETPR